MGKQAPAATAASGAGQVVMSAASEVVEAVKTAAADTDGTDDRDHDEL